VLFAAELAQQVELVFGQVEGDFHGVSYRVVRGGFSDANGGHKKTAVGRAVDLCHSNWRFVWRFAENVYGIDHNL